jgi:sugar/nucleoside kinase (ribokinase family)
LAAGVSCGVVCIQGTPWIPLIRQMMEAAGIRPYIIPRPGEGAALTVGVPNGKPGAVDLWVQRLTPNLRLAELNDEIVAALHAAEIVALGPMANVDGETLELHEFVAETAQRSVLVPHPDLIRHPRFGELAGQFTCVAVNGREAALLDPGTDDPVKHALRLQHVVGEEVELVVTNGPERGLIWAGGHWHWFEPPAVNVVNDAGAGDVFSTVFAIWRQRGALPLDAADRAMAAAARWISGQPLVSLTWSEHAL